MVSMGDWSRRGLWLHDGTVRDAEEDVIPTVLKNWCSCWAFYLFLHLQDFKLRARLQTKGFGTDDFPTMSANDMASDLKKLERDRIRKEAAEVDVILAGGREVVGGKSEYLIRCPQFEKSLTDLGTGFSWEGGG